MIFSCKKRFLEIEQEFKELKCEIHRLKKAKREGGNKVSSLTDTSVASTASGSNLTDCPTGSTDDIYNGHTKTALQDAISHTDKAYQAVRILLGKLFSEDYILSHSVSGKASNWKHNAKPAFDQRIFSTMVGIIKKKFTNVVTKEITEKVHSVQKVLIRKIKK